MFYGQSGRGLLGIRVGLPDALSGRSDIDGGGSSATGLLGFALPSLPVDYQPQMGRERDIQQASSTYGPSETQKDREERLFKREIPRPGIPTMPASRQSFAALFSVARALSPRGTSTGARQQDCLPFNTEACLNIAYSTYSCRAECDGSESIDISVRLFLRRGSSPSGYSCWSSTCIGGKSFVQRASVHSP